MNIDHVTIAGSSLDPMREVFAQIGLATDYGGPHSNGITHMALLGFDDGSYIELISTLKPGQGSPWWDRFIREDAGPCAWAIRSDDVPAEAKRLAGLGVPVRGPEVMSRQRPDGQSVEWELAFIGDGDPGVTLPFIIHDRTPRERRVTPSASVTGSELRGVARVIITAADLKATARQFHKLYGALEAPLDVDEYLPAELQTFENIPLDVAYPFNPNTPLGMRLQQYATCPMAFLLRSADMEQSGRRFPTAERGHWFGDPVLWLPTGNALPWVGVIPE